MSNITANGSLEALARFPYPSAERLRSCAGESKPVADLARTFPLVFSLLATRHGTLESRQRIVRLVELGRPLTEVAAVKAVPLCFRRLPPEACRERLPDVGWSQNASRMLGDRIPKDPNVAAAWLPAIYFGLAAAGEDFAFWLAKQHALFEGPRLPASACLPLALYAWHSSTHSPLRHLVYAPWHPRMRFAAAALETRNFLHRVKVSAYLDGSGALDPWVTRASIDGYDFVPLLTGNDILSESLAMSNCLDSYAERLVTNRCRVFSIRRHGERVADIEIEPMIRDIENSPPFVITQLKGPFNCDAPEEIWRASWKWLTEHGATPAPLGPAIPGMILQQRLARAFEAYVAGRPTLEIDWKEFLTSSKLHASVLTLARRAGLPHSIMLFG